MWNGWNGASLDVANIYYVLLRDSTVLGQSRVFPQMASGAGAPLAGGGNAAKVEAFDTPTAAAHTYSLKAFCDAIGANQIPQVIAGAGGSGNQLPAYLRVTKA